MEGVAEGSDASFTGFGASAGGFGASTGGFGASSEGTFGAGGFGEGTFGAGGFGEAQQFGSTDFGGGGFGQPPAAFGSGSTGFGEAQGPHTTTGTTGGFGAGGFGASDGGFGAPASGAAPGSFGASTGGFGASTGGFGASSEGTFGAGGFGEGTFGAGGFGEAQQFGSTDFGGGGFGQPPAAFGSGSTGFGEAQGPHTTTGTTGGFGAGGFGASDGGFGAPASGAAPGSFGASTGGFGASTGGFGASSEGTFGAGGFGEGTFGAGGFGEAQQFGSTDFGGGGFGQPPAAFGGGSTGFGQTPAFPATKLEVIAEGFGVGYPMTSNPFEAFPTADSGPQFSYQAFPTAGSGPPEFFYHGTSLEAAMKIQQVGFDVGRSGSNNGAQLGRGLYVTTTMQKALNYAAKHPCQGAIFELKVDLGRCYTVHVNDSNRAKWQEMGYDSAWAPEGVLPAAGSFEENCIKDPRPPRVQITKVSLGHTGEAKRAGYWIDSAGKLQKGLTFSLPFGFGGPAPTKLAPKPVVPPRDASNSEDCKSQTSKGSSKSASSRISSISSMLKRRFLQRTGFGVAASDSSSVCQDFDSDTSSVYHVCHVFDDDSDTSSVVGSGSKVVDGRHHPGKRVHKGRCVGSCCDCQKPCTGGCSRSYCAGDCEWTCCGKQGRNSSWPGCTKV